MRDRLLPLIAALAAFGLSLGGVFHLDDYSLFSHPLVMSPDGWLTLWGPLQTRPLTYLTFWINAQAGGDAPLGYHVVNLALHLAAVWLFVWALEPLLAKPVLVFAACLFAAHPIQAEPVNYIFARSTLLMTVFCLASLGCWIRGRTWVALALFAAALLAKEECAAFPLFLAWLDSRDNRRRLTPAVLMVALSLAAGLRVIWATSQVGGSGSGFSAGVTPLVYFMAQGFSILHYLRLIVLPAGFSVEDSGMTGWIGWAIVAVLARFCWRREPWGWWFLAGFLLLLPSSSVLPAADFSADRRVYLPMIAWSVGIALLTANIPARIRYGAVALLAALSVFTCYTWNSEERLWRQAESAAPRAIRPKLQLARVTPPETGLKLLEEARQLDPEDARVPAEEGRIYLAANRPGEALAAFGRALALSPNDARAINNRGVALEALGQKDAAIGDFQRALSIDPCLFDARLNLRKLGSAVEKPPVQCRYTPREAALIAPVGSLP